jgi:hypothetical protein
MRTLDRSPRLVTPLSAVNALASNAGRSIPAVLAILAAAPAPSWA